MKIEMFILYKVTTKYAGGDTRVTNAAVPAPGKSGQRDITYAFGGGAELVRKRLLASVDTVLSTVLENMGTVEVITED